jgi:alkanesulfonate monooxygenase SsuD/methylene tetrahydromethanopterin reductase-like flavin-dependent oxidoreductase (luciferase family)
VVVAAAVVVVAFVVVVVGAVVVDDGVDVVVATVVVGGDEVVPPPQAAEPTASAATSPTTAGRRRRGTVLTARHGIQGPGADRGTPAGGTTVRPVRRDDATDVRVGMFLPRDVQAEGPAAWRSALAAMADAGIDHVGSADHVSFHTGWGIDGLVHATALAAMEPRLDAAVGVYLLPLRHPVPVARSLVTMAEALAPRAIEFGVGVGGEDRHEVEVCGVDPATRGRRCDESLAVLRLALTGRPFDFDGEFFTLERACIAPAPPTPIAIVVGGRAPAALRRAGRHGDGWLGVWSEPDRYAARVAAVEAAAADAGRAVPDGGWQHGLQLWVGIGDDGRAPLARAMEGMYRLPYERFERFSPWGSPARIAEYLAPYLAAGCRSFSVSAQATRWPDAIDGLAEVRRLLRAEAGVTGR